MCNAADEPAVLDENLVKLLDALAAALAPGVSQAAGPAQIPPADGGFCPAQKGGRQQGKRAVFGSVHL